MCSERLSEKELKWLYKLMEVPMTEFDCGQLCVTEENGVPPCCDALKTVPVLFKSEYEWHRKRNDFWRQMNEDDPVYNTFCELIDADDYEQFAICPGVEGCDRDQRSLVCRTYPFEPYIDEDGRLKGITFNYDEEEVCPLVSKLDLDLNGDYITNSLIYWDFIFKRFPDQFDIYYESSQQLRESGRNFRVFN